MPKKVSTGKVTGLSDQAVKKATGKSWQEWLAILDKAGARKMTHTKNRRETSSAESMDELST